MKGKTKTILTIVIAILIFATAVVGTVTFLKDDGEASAAEEGVGNTLPVTGSDDEQANNDGEKNPAEGLEEEENPVEGDDGDSEEGTTVEGETTTGTTGTQGTTVGGQLGPEPTTIEQERLVSTTLNWSSISLNSTIGDTGINYTNLAYTVKYYQVVNEEETNLLNTEAGIAEYASTVTVSEEQIKENCPVGYKLDETSELSVVISENVEANLIEVYYIKDETQQKELSYAVEYYIDGNKVTEDCYTVSEKVWVNAPDTLTVGEVDTANNKYTGYKLAENKYKLNDDVIAEIPETVANGDVIKVYYVRDDSQQKELSYTVEYYKDGNKVTEDCYSVPAKVWVNATDTITVGTVDTSSTKYTGYKLAKKDTFKLNDEIIEAIPETVTNGDVIKVFYEKDTFEYTVEYYYENASGEFVGPDEIASYTKSAKYQDVVTYEPKDQNGTYVFFKVESAGVEGEANLTVTERTENNIIKVYYERNSYDYKVVYYKDSLNGTKLGETAVKEQKLGTVMNSDLVAADFGAEWINAFKSELDAQEGYQNGEVQEYITIQSNDNNVINVVYEPRTDIGYTVEYYFNNEPDTTGKNYSGIATYGEDIEEVTDYSNSGEWTLDTTKSTALPFTIGVANNVIRVYYIKPEITVEKTRTVNTDRTEGAANTVEPGETITYTITATNNGYKAGTVTIADTVPTGTTLVGDITVTGYTKTTVTQEELKAGIELTVLANRGTASVTFTVTVTANVNNNIVNTPSVNGTKDPDNTVINPVEKTINVVVANPTITNSNVVIVIDTSKSMNYVQCEAQYCSKSSHQHDWLKTSATPEGWRYHKDETMLNAAKRVANEFIDTINLSTDSNNIESTVAVIQYDTDAPSVGSVTTLASGRETLKNAVSRMTTDYNTYMDLGLNAARNKFSSMKAGNNNIVIFLSDGDPTEREKVLPAATALKEIATVYTIGFGADADTEILQNTIASSTDKYFSAADGTYSSLSNAFQQAGEDITGGSTPTQSDSGLVELEGVFADENHPISITVNNSATPEKIYTIPDESGKIILKNEKYYLNLSKYNALDSISVKYFANN